MRPAQHVTIVAIKWLLTGAALAVALPAGGVTVPGSMLALSLLTAVSLYIVGDLVLLPRLGATAAAAGDGILAALLVNWLIAAQTGLRLRPAGFFAVILTIAIVEWLLHPTLLRLIHARPGASRVGTVVVPAVDREHGRTRVGNSPIPVDPINDPSLPLIPGDNNQVQEDGEQPARTGAASRAELAPPGESRPAPSDETDGKPTGFD